jgi:DNA-binding CsgD family transcriptional regulator
MIELFATASRRLRRHVPFDAAMWLALDPETGLPSGPARLERFDAARCLRSWELELLTEDVNPFGELARADRPAASLALSTGGHLARSPRFREVLAPAGFGDELRAVMRVGGCTWGALGLLRRGDRFAPADVERVAELSRPLGEELRADARRPAARRAEARGLAVFSPGGEPISVNEDALVLLDELAFDPETHVGTLPLGPAIALVAARAVAEGRTGGPARTCARSRAGSWIACHATCLRDRDGAIAGTALLVEPAGGPELAAISVRAHGLTARERQIAQLISDGCSTAQMAQRLHLSAHTVRDYVKSALGKVGVSTRGELVARLIAGAAA